MNQQILERSLQTWFPAQGLRRNAMDTTLSLYQEYQKLLPERLFTPRDLTDFLSRLSYYLSHSEPPSVQNKAGLYGLIWQAMEDSLGGELPESHQKALTYLVSKSLSERQILIESG